MCIIWYVYECCEGGECLAQCSVAVYHQVNKSQILSVEVKNIDGGRGSAPDPHWESSWRSSRPLVEPGTGIKLINLSKEILLWYLSCIAWFM